MILVTGAAGFIGSAMIWHLNTNQDSNILISDKLKEGEKWLNISNLLYYDWIDRDDLFNFLASTDLNITSVIHMGACSSTTENDADFLMKNNYEYTKNLWKYCTEKQIAFIYASSAATYGNGENGYNDKLDLKSSEKLSPLNKYGYSKKIFDIWAMKQSKTPKRWYGLKFFNVYGPNEYHKDRMASMVFHAYNQFSIDKEVKLFKSYNKGYNDGEQLRDFIYVKDVVKIISFMLENNFVESGIYNLGTGTSRTFYDLAKITVDSMGGDESNIKFVSMPKDLRDKYQYFTEANIDKLVKNGYTDELFTLESGIKDYVENYLLKKNKYLKKDEKI